MSDDPEKHDSGGGLGGWGPIIAAVAITIATILLYRNVRQYSLDQIIASVTSVPHARILSAGGFAFASYLCLTGVDWLAVRYAGHPLSYRRAALTSFTSLSLGHNIGLAFLSSGAIRYRFYSRWGLNVEAVAKVIIFAGATVGLGLMTLGGITLLLRTEVAHEITGLHQVAIVAIGVACLAGTAAYLALAAFVREPLSLFGHKLSLPSIELALAQVAVGSTNFAFVAACLHQVLSAVTDVEYFGTVSAYVTANVAALISHIPGGLGVIESVVIYLLPEGNLIGSLIIFRIVYFLVPLTIGSVVFAGAELYYLRRGGGDESRSRSKGKAELSGLFDSGGGGGSRTCARDRAAKSQAQAQPDRRPTSR